MIDRQLLFWIFSTSAQSLAAIIAVYGMFIVYKLQEQRNQIESVKKQFYRAYMQARSTDKYTDIHNFTASPEYYTFEELRSEMKKIKEKYSQLDINKPNVNEKILYHAKRAIQIFDNVNQEYKAQLSNLTNIKKRATGPFLLTLSAFIYSMVGLFVIDFSLQQCFWISFLVGMFLLVSSSAMWAVLSILGILRSK